MTLDLPNLIAFNYLNSVGIFFIELVFSIDNHVGTADDQIFTYKCPTTRKTLYFVYLGLVFPFVIWFDFEETADGIFLSII